MEFVVTNEDVLTVQQGSKVISSNSSKHKRIAKFLDLQEDGSIGPNAGLIPIPKAALLENFIETIKATNGKFDVKEYVLSSSGRLLKESKTYKDWTDNQLALIKRKMFKNTIGADHYENDVNNTLNTITRKQIQDFLDIDCQGHLVVALGKTKAARYVAEAI